MTHGLLERFVKQHPGAQQRKRQVMEWLDSLALVWRNRSVKTVAIVDTSIFCNVLNIPHMNSERIQVMQELRGVT